MSDGGQDESHAARIVYSGEPGKPMIVVEDGTWSDEHEEPPPTAAVVEMIAQARFAKHNGLYLAALMLALALPDICGALESQNGHATGNKTKAWLVQNLGCTEGQAKLIYGFRCSLLHQGSAYPHQSPLRIAMGGPDGGNGQLHWVETQYAEDVVLWLSLPDFVDQLCAAVALWLENNGDTDVVRTNLDKFVRWRPDGLFPFYVGAPVLA